MQGGPGERVGAGIEEEGLLQGTSCLLLEERKRVMGFAIGLGISTDACGMQVAEIYFDAVRAFGAGHGPEQKEAIRQQVDQQVEKRVKVVDEKLWRLVESSGED